MHEEIKSLLNSGHSCYHQVQNFISACLQPKNINIRIYRAIIFYVVKIGLTLREEHRLSTSETTVLRKIFVFGPKRDEEIEGLKKKLQNEELHGLYSLLNIIWIFKSMSMRWAEHEAHMRKNRNIDRVLWGHLTERDHFGRCKDNFKLDLQHADRVWTGSVSLRERNRGKLL